MNGATSTGSVTVSNTGITNSRSDGARLDLTNAAIGSLLVDQLTITDSSTRGLNVILDGVTGSTVDITNVVVSSPTVGFGGGRGVSIEGAAATLGDVTLTNVSSDRTTVGEGVALILNTGGTVGAIDFTNVSANDSAAGGILVNLDTETVNAPIALVGGLSSFSTNNGGDGIRVSLNNLTSAPDVSITDYEAVGSIYNNAGNGIALLTNGTAVGRVDVLRNTVSTSTAGDGILLNLTNSTVGPVTVATATITDSSTRGLNVILDGVTGSTVDITNVVVSSPTVGFGGGRGVSIEGAAATLGDVTLTNVSSDRTTVGEGVALILNTGGTVGAIDFTNVSANDSAAGGILVNLDTETVNAPIALVGGLSSFSTNNGGDGIRVELNAVAGMPDVSVTDYSLPNAILNNNGNGIAVLNNGSPVGNVTVSRNLVSQSNFGDGILVDLGGTIGVVLLDGNTVSNSSNNGIDVNLDTVTGSDVTISNSTVTDSAGGDGVRLFTRNSTLNDLLIDTVSVTRSNIDGIAVIDDPVGAGSSINSITLRDVNSDTTTLGTGVTVQLTNTTNLASVDIIGTGNVIDSAFDGMNIVLTGVVTGTPDLTIDGYTVTRSGNRGMFIDTNGSAVGDVTVANFAVTDSGSPVNVQSQGVVIDLTNSAVGSVTVNNTNAATNTITNSTGRGLDLILDGVTLANSIDISDLAVTNSGIGGISGRGVSVAGVGSAGNQMLLGTNALTGLINLTNVSSDLTGAEDGVVVDFSADVVASGKVGDITLTNVSADNSFAGGIVTSLNTMTFDPTITLDGLGAAHAIGNGGDGILVTVDNILLPGAAPLDVININVQDYLLVDNNVGRGIAVESNGERLGTVNVSGNNVDRSTSLVTGQGIQLDLTNSELAALFVLDNTIANSSDRGLDVILNGVNRGTNVDAPVITINSITVGQSEGRGVSVEGTGAATDLGDIFLTNVTSTDTGADEGVAVVFSAGATLDSIFLNNVTALNSSTTGILVDLNTVTVGPTILVNGGQSTNNGTGVDSDGILINLDTVTPDTTLDVSIDNYASVSNNTGGGVALVANATLLDNLTVSGNTINNNTGGNGLTIDLTGSNATDLTINANIIGSNTGEGVFISQNTSNVGSIFIGTDNLSTTGLGNTITGNTLNGVNVAVTASSQGVVTFMENQITGQVTGDGVHVGPVGDLDNSLDFAFFRNTITTNAGDGVNVVLPVPGLLNPTLNLSFTNDTISNNTGNGILVDLTAVANSNVTANVSVFSDNTVVNPIGGSDFANISNNGGMGLFIDSSRINVANTNDIVLTTGGTGGLNLFNANRDAGIGIELGSFSTLQTNVAGSSFTNTVNGAQAIYNGDGVSIVMTDNSEYTNSTFNNMTFTGNAGSGFSLQTTNAASADSLTFSNSTFSNNTTNGLLFSRNSTVPNNGFIQNISIDTNQINDNNVGINILAEFAPTTDTYSVTNNTINSNNSHGIQLDLTADANIGLVLNTNFITNNGGDGINARANYGATDAGEHAIQSNNDTITGNTGDGVDVIAIHNASFNVATVSNNGGNGITLNGTNTLFGNPFSVTPFGGATTNVALVGNSITNSFVDDNGAAGIVMTNQGAMFINIGTTQVNRNGADGIDLLNSGSMTSQLMTATLNQNFIGANGGDGIQYAGVGTGGSIVGNPGTLTAVNSYANQFAVPFLGNNNLAFTNNTLQANRARGINVLNGGNIATDLNISSNIIDRSQLEGVYIVNTAATAQNVDANANAAMATGDALADPRLGLTVFNNQITSNGQIQTAASVFDTTGLVIRVGTSDASNSIRDNGGFASATGVTNANVLANGGLISQMGRGGVQALVRNNTLGGNYAADVTFQGFVSTTNPATSAGQWTDNNDGTNPPPGPPTAPRNNGNDIFRVDGYVSDPLSRLDLVFSNNTGDALRATRADAASILYNNAEDVFKSRTRAQDAADFPVGGFDQSNVNNGDDGGPFDSGSRARNATRLADNAGFNAPVGVGSVVDVQNPANGFLFSGVSLLSTFRQVQPVANVFGLVSAGFGAQINQGGGVGENNFKWDAFP